ncbi:hypothetical protein A7X12_08890 [Sphingomonas sp. TDK1]|nr:methyl-accepting chemotaxis protein [Sphingomonas sp. TDK1]OAN57311.1 hypothetical protein A7X12_08890 [Sphingomonas sp. TDK1]
MLRSFIVDWRISSKMLAIFAAVAVLVCILGATSLISNEKLAAVAQDHVERGIDGTDALGRLASTLREQRIIIWRRLNAESPQEVAELRTRFDRNEADIQRAIADYQRVADELQPRLLEIRAGIATLRKVNLEIFDVVQRSGAAAAFPLMKGPSKKASNALRDAVDHIQDQHRARSARSNAVGLQAERFAVRLTWIVIFTALGAIFAIWRLLQFAVATPLADVSGATKRLSEGGEADVPHRDRRDEIGDVANAVESFRLAAIARCEADARTAEEQGLVCGALRRGLTALTQGDLTANVEEQFPPAYEQLREDFNGALASLRDLIGTVRTSAAMIFDGAGEIAHASNDLARRTESNAASLEQTAAAIAEVDARVRGSGVATDQTVARAQQATDVVGQGRALADEAVQAMGRVADSAKGIDGVIEGLDKIAFQTRVLAMNAAVEAGRAGEAGRGFAVVADLVSVLAMRAEEEAGRAREQLSSTRQDVQVAMGAVDKVDGALSEIAASVDTVHQLLHGIGVDHQAQAATITEIAASIATIDHATQQNAAMVEQTSAATAKLSVEVEALQTQSSRFNVSDRRSGAATPRRGRTAPATGLAFA